MVNNALLAQTEYEIFSINPATCAENWRTRHPGALLPANRGAAYLDGMLFRGTKTVACWPSDLKTRDIVEADRRPETRCRRRQSPGMASSSAMPVDDLSKAAKAICTRSRPPATVCGSSFSKAEGTWCGPLGKSPPRPGDLE